MPKDALPNNKSLIELAVEFEEKATVLDIAAKTIDARIKNRVLVVFVFLPV